MFKISDIAALLIVGLIFYVIWLYQTGRKLSPKDPFATFPLVQYWRRYWPNHPPKGSQNDKLSVFESAMKGDFGHLPDESGEGSSKR